jgi:hypothetical protein
MGVGGAEGDADRWVAARWASASGVGLVIVYLFVAARNVELHADSVSGHPAELPAYRPHIAKKKALVQVCTGPAHSRSV